MIFLIDTRNFFSRKVNLLQFPLVVCSYSTCVILVTVYTGGSTFGVLWEKEFIFLFKCFRLSIEKAMFNRFLGWNGFKNLGENYWMIILGSIFILDVERIQTLPFVLCIIFYLPTHTIFLFILWRVLLIWFFIFVIWIPCKIQIHLLFKPFARVISIESREHPLHIHKDGQMVRG